MSKNKKKVVAPVVKAPEEVTKVEKPVIAPAETSTEKPVVTPKADEKKPEIDAKEVKDTPKVTPVISPKPQPKVQPKVEPKVEKTVEVKSESQTQNRPQQKPRPSSVTPSIIQSSEKAGIKASDAILLASLNQNAIMHSMYADTPELQQSIHRMAGITLATANVLFLAEMKETGKELGIIVKDEEIPNFLAGCAILGITGIKALPAKPSDGQTIIDFTDAEVPKEVTEAAKEEKKVLDTEVVKGIPELDPAKIETPEALTDALLHILCRDHIGETRKTGKKVSPAENFIMAMNLVSAYYLKSATTEDAKKEVASHDAAFWANEVFILIGNVPTLRLRGLCMQLYTNAAGAGNLFPSHGIFHNSTQYMGIPETTVAKIVPVLIGKIAKEKCEKEKKEVSKDFGITAINDTGLELVNKLLSIEDIEIRIAEAQEKADTDGKKRKKDAEEDNLGTYKRTRGIFTAMYFTSEARTLPTFMDTLREKLTEIAKLYEEQAATKKK